jgi:hypothetical protein
MLGQARNESIQIDVRNLGWGDVYEESKVVTWASLQ